MQTPEIPGGSANGSVLAQTGIPIQTHDSQGGLAEDSILAPSVISRLSEEKLGKTIFIVTSANGKIRFIFNIA